MRPVDLAFNQLLGIRAAPDGAPHLLELPWSHQLCNHVGTVHAAAQFALAEAASAECLRRAFPDLAGSALAVVRQADVRYRKAATGDLHAFAKPAAETADGLHRELAARKQAFAHVEVELRSPDGTVTFVGRFTWYVRPPAA